MLVFFFFSSRRRHTRCSRDWSSDVALPIWAVARQVRGGAGERAAQALRQPAARGGRAGYEGHLAARDAGSHGAGRSDDAEPPPPAAARAGRLRAGNRGRGARFLGQDQPRAVRSEEHTSELQSRLHLVCRLLLEKKKNKIKWL